jgi:hypothetical protein
MKKSKPAPKPKTKAAKRLPTKPAAPAAKRNAPAPSVEHRLAVASVGVAVSYGPARSEQLEFRGAATVNATLPNGGTRSAGVASIVLRKGAKIAGTAAYNPASFNRTFELTLAMEEADFALFHDVFVKNPGGYDPGLRLWVHTAEALDTEAGSDRPVTGFGYRLDLVQTPSGQR